MRSGRQPSPGQPLPRCCRSRQSPRRPVAPIRRLRPATDASAPDRPPGNWPWLQPGGPRSRDARYPRVVDPAVAARQWCRTVVDIATRACRVDASSGSGFHQSDDAAGVGPARSVRRQRRRCPVGRAVQLEPASRHLVRARRGRLFVSDGAARNTAVFHCGARLRLDPRTRARLLPADAGTGIGAARRVHGTRLVAVLRVLGTDPDPAVLPDRPLGGATGTARR